MIDELASSVTDSILVLKTFCFQHQMSLITTELSRGPQTRCLWSLCPRTQQLPTAFLALLSASLTFNTRPVRTAHAQTVTNVIPSIRTHPVLATVAYGSSPERSNHVVSLLSASHAHSDANPLRQSHSRLDLAVMMNRCSKMILSSPRHTVLKQLPGFLCPSGLQPLDKSFWSDISEVKRSKSQ